MTLLDADVFARVAAGRAARSRNHLANLENRVPALAEHVETTRLSREKHA